MGMGNCWHQQTKKHHHPGPPRRVNSGRDPGLKPSFKKHVYDLDPGRSLPAGAGRDDELLSFL